MMIYFWLTADATRQYSLGTLGKLFNLSLLILYIYIYIVYICILYICIIFYRICNVYYGLIEFSLYLQVPYASALLGILLFLASPSVSSIKYIFTLTILF